MNSHDEQRTLRSLRDALKNPASVQKPWISFVLYSLGAVGIWSGYWTAVRELLDVRLAIAIACIGGMLIGIGSFYSTCQKQSKFVLQHLSVESIEKRLRELDT